MKDWVKIMMANFVAGALLLWIWNRKNANAPQTPEGNSASAAPAMMYGGGNVNVDLSPLISYLARLTPPNILSIGKSISSGTTEIVPSEGGKRITVLAYSVTTAGSNTVEFRSNGATLWRQTFDAAAGKTGANLATAFPTRLFASPVSGNLEINTSAACDISVTYFLETA